MIDRLLFSMKVKGLHFVHGYDWLFAQKYSPPIPEKLREVDMYLRSLYSLTQKQREVLYLHFLSKEKLTKIVDK